MKITNLRRTLSVLLALALLAATAIPLSLFSVSAEGGTSESAVENLKTAWQGMKKISNKLDLTAYNSGGEAINFESGTEEATVPAYSAKIITGSTSAVSLVGVEDFIMYYKLPAESDDVGLKISSVTQPNWKEFSQRGGMTVTLTADGTWHELKLSDMYKDSTTYPTWQSYWANQHSLSEYDDSAIQIQSLSFLASSDIIPAGSSFKSTLLVSSQNDYPTEDTSAWTAADWYTEAKAINVNEYYNSEAFVTAIAELEKIDEIAEYLAVENLKTAWKNLETIYYTADPALTVNASGTVNFGSLDTLDDYRKATSESEKNLLGNYTATVKNSRLIKTNNPDKALSEFTDILVAYKLNAGETATFYFRPTIRGSTKGFHQQVYLTNPVTVTGDGDWQTVRISDYYSGDWRDYFKNKSGESDYSNVIINEFAIVTTTSGTSYTLTGTFGSPIFLNKVSDTNACPDDSESPMSALEWYKAARSIDASEYFNSEAFAAALAELEKIDEIAEYIVVENLKTAWQGMKKIENQLDIWAYNIGGETTKLDPLAPEVNFSAAGRKVITGKDNDNKSLVGVEDIVMQYKLPAGSEDVTVGIEAVTGNWQPIRKDSCVTLIADGEWHGIKLSDIYDWKTEWAAKYDSLSSYDENTVEAMKLSLYASTDIIPAGSSFKSTLLVSNQNDYPTAETSTWTVAEWYNAAKAINVNKYYNSKAFAKAFSALAVLHLAGKISSGEFNISDLKEADDLILDTGNSALSGYLKLKTGFDANKGVIKSGDCTYNDEVDICDLVRMRQYLNDTSTDIFKYAAKMGTEEIGESNLSSLRTMLLAE